MKNSRELTAPGPRAVSPRLLAALKRTPFKVHLGRIVPTGVKGVAAANSPDAPQ